MNASLVRGSDVTSERWHKPQRLDNGGNFTDEYLKLFQNEVTIPVFEDFVRFCARAS